MEKTGVNIIDAAARGAGDGLQLALNIAAMLIAFLGADRDGQRHPGRGAFAARHVLAPGSLQQIFGHGFSRRSPGCWA